MKDDFLIVHKKILPVYFEKVHGVTDDGVAVLSSGNTIFLVTLQ